MDKTIMLMILLPGIINLHMNKNIEVDHLAKKIPQLFTIMCVVFVHEQKYWHILNYNYKTSHSDTYIYSLKSVLTWIHNEVSVLWPK